MKVNINVKSDKGKIKYYDIESISEFLSKIKGSIRWIDIIEYIASKNKPVILATGASTLEDVKRAVETIQKKHDKIVLMQCNTNYTMSYENYKHINLNVLKSYKKLFPNVILGLSDHTQGHSTVLGAIALGACVIEKHFTDDNNRKGPDHKFSMNPSTWSEMVDRSMELWYALGDGIKKIEDNEKDTAIIQRRGLYYTKNIKKGTILTKEHIFPLRPIKKDGLHPWEIDCILGKAITKDVNKDDYVKLEDFE
jgi:N-acetylneuraminate synthase